MRSVASERRERSSGERRRPEAREPPRGFETQIPYIVGLIEMDEGVKLTAQIVDVEPKDVHIGMRVKDVFRKVREDGPAGVIHYSYKFAPVTSPHGGATPEHPENLAAAQSAPMDGLAACAAARSVSVFAGVRAGRSTSAI